MDKIQNITPSKINKMTRKQLIAFLTVDWTETLSKLDIDDKTKEYQNEWFNHAMGWPKADLLELAISVTS